MSVTLVIGRSHALAGLFLVAMGALVSGALIAPEASQAVTTYTRTASCAGLDFYPTDSRTEYDNDGTLRVWRGDYNTTDGTGIFRCDPGLPTGAVVKEVQFTVGLLRGYGPTRCALVRSGLTVATATTAQTVGSVSFTGGTTTGAVRRTTNTIATATIDDANWGYWLECQSTTPTAWGDSAGIGIYGADVIYTITAAKG